MGQFFMVGVVIAASSLAAGLAVLVLTLFNDRRLRGVQLGADWGADTVFLFDGPDLIDATPRARRLLNAAAAGQSDWQRAMSALAPRFPGLAGKIHLLAGSESVALKEADGTATLTATQIGSVLRICLTSGTEGSEPDAAPAASDAELSILRAVTEHLPTVSWCTDQGGDIIWANPAYFDRIQAFSDETEPLSWPIKPLFRAGDLAALNDGVSFKRLSLTNARDQPAWFDCTSHGDGTFRYYFATPADAAARAETALSNFMQTLSQTFAQLPIGLAIFNRQRQLVMFNPALCDLSHLDAQFLAERPSLRSFLDRLREHRAVPEPKDFGEWRDKIATLEHQAANGVHQETWPLPNGRTYRVTGRPHPDGALAFLFEDISAEISQTRRYRTELSVSQSVIDTLPDAIAVFSPSGILTLSNMAYSDMWGCDPSLLLAEVTINDSRRLWHSRLKDDGQTTASLQSSVAGRTVWHGIATLKSGQRLDCSAQPLPGGSSMVVFRRMGASGAHAALDGAHAVPS